MTKLDKYPLWKRTLAIQNDENEAQRTRLRESFLRFRDRVKHLVGEIAGLLPDLTVHDITHLDELWRVAGTIAGDDYPINPAEAYVLGGAFLLHDAAHVLAAYPDRLTGIKSTLQWRDLVAQQFDGVEPANNSPQEKFALFQILRQLHATQARQLPHLAFIVPGESTQQFLIQDFDLREYFGSLIGEIAESHHWTSHRVAEEFESRTLNAPSFLHQTWKVDVLKIAFLLRTADAAHIDGGRAPWFLFALRQPQGISEQHWRFQAKLGQLTRNGLGDLSVTSGSPFSIRERQAWWLAYDTAKMIDRELRDAERLMQENRYPTFAASGVSNIATPITFANGVRTKEWEPVNVEPVIRDVAKVIENFGGAKLYGDNPELALRELIQNGVDAVRALRALSYLEPLEGEIEVALTLEDGQLWLHVTDQGIGMSRHVLTEVLPDFGNSLWGSELLRSELPGLASAGFKSIGQFGIGFYSVFMLGGNVRVTSRRFRKADNDTSDQWLLEFENRLSGRPILRKPLPLEELRKSGTRISVAISAETLKKIVRSNVNYWEIPGLSFFENEESHDTPQKKGKLEIVDFGLIVANLCPTLDIKVFARVGSNPRIEVVKPNDWMDLSEVDLLARLYARKWEIPKDTQLFELLEPTGQLVGRVGYGKMYGAVCFATHAGILSAEIQCSTVGVFLTSNNSNLRRSDAKPSASKTAWTGWAERVLAGSKNLRREMMLTLHPLCADKDLSVYELGGDEFCENDLLAWLQDKDEIFVYLGEPMYDEDEDISETQFNDGFEAEQEILFCPKSKSSLASLVKFDLINYQARLEAILVNAWGNFEEIADNTTIGSVGTVDIDRQVCFYIRREPYDE